MKDISAYIESGVLELYVLGDLSPVERAEVEQMASTHPAIKAELNEVEKALERYAEQNAVQPSGQHRVKTLGSIVINFADDSTFDEIKRQTKTEVIQLKPPTAGNFYKYAFAASVTLLIGSLFALYNVYNKLQHSNQQLIVLNTQNEKFSKVINQMDEEISVFRDPSFKRITLTGTDKMPAAKMTVAWSPAKKKVMIDMVSMDLPKNDDDHQYQLWALVDGKPVDLGVFDAPEQQSADMVPMKSVALASAFAVTLEPRGGSVNPTMSEMMVIGQF